MSGPIAACRSRATLARWKATSSCVCPQTNEAVAVRVPTASRDDCPRGAHHTPPGEVALAVHLLLLEAKMAAEAELSDAVNRRFGLAWMGPRVQRVLSEALAAREAESALKRTATGQPTARDAPTTTSR